jgi:hypothetical protein
MYKEELSIILYSILITEVLYIIIIKYKVTYNLALKQDFSIIITDYIFIRVL